MVEVQSRVAELERTCQELSHVLRSELWKEVSVDAGRTGNQVREDQELMLRHCRQSLEVMVRADGISCLPLDEELLAQCVSRGVRLRVVLDEQLAGQDAMPTWTALSGSDGRTAPGVPVSLIAADDRTVLLVEAGAADSDPRATLVTQQSMVDALVGLFEAYWARGAVPAHDDSDGAAPPLLERHRELAELLAAGHTDEAIARARGVSVRKLGREITTLRQDLGARTRFQAGAAAARARLL